MSTWGRVGLGLLGLVVEWQEPTAAGWWHWGCV